MRKLRLVKVVRPELIAYIMHGEERLPDYECGNCGAGVAEDYVCCPWCGAELDWNRHHESDSSKAFRKLME